MSMAMALEFVRDWLREKNGWNYTNCGVHQDAEPSLEAASPFYVSIDEAGVESPDSETDSLKETLSIRIGIWRKPEHLFQDKRGILKLPSDIYLTGSFALAEIERKIIVHKMAAGAQKHGLHRNYQFVQALNQRYNLPDEGLGDKFNFPFRYLGKGAMEELGLINSQGNVQTWIGYRLRFKGLAREQKMRQITDCIG